MQIASANTKKGIETCAILSGTYAQSGPLTVSHIIIPEQLGTPNYCSATNEVDISDIQRLLNVASFGWVYTHPTQDSFLFSIDIYTQYAYQ